MGQLLPSSALLCAPLVSIVVCLSDGLVVSEKGALLSAIGNIFKGDNVELICLL